MTRRFLIVLFEYFFPPAPTRRGQEYGQHYNLQEIYDAVNGNYFQNRIKLPIRWFAPPNYRKFSHMTFGSYHPDKKWIRINGLLDHPEVPRYFIEYIVYHEMLHHVCPFETDSAGRCIVHTKHFRKREEQFEHFDKAMRWEQRSLQFFRKVYRKLYGRA